MVPLRVDACVTEHPGRLVDRHKVIVSEQDGLRTEAYRFLGIHLRNLSARQVTAGSP